MRSEYLLFDHIRDPYHAGHPAKVASTASISSLYCADQVTLCVVIDDSRVQEVWYQAQGCLVCQAAASYLCEWAETRLINELRAATTPDFLSPLGPLTPMRQQCALLSLRCLKTILESISQA